MPTTSRRVLRIIGRVALCTVAIVALVVGASWSLLQTKRGSEALRRFALPRVNAMLAGSVGVERLSFGGNRLTLDEVVLADPDGNVVAHVEQIDVTLALWQLVHRHVDVRTLAIRRPELTLVEDARGLNLTRALAPRHARPPAPPAGASARGDDRGVAISVRALSITGGAIDYRSSKPGAARHVLVDDVGVRAALALAGNDMTATASVTARGGQVDVAGRLDTAAMRGHVTVDARLPGARLTADGGIDGDAIHAQAGVDATDLAMLARRLRLDDKAPPAAIAGQGHVNVAVTGTRSAPSLRVTARFPSLHAGDARVRQLAASVVIPDVRTPEALDADVTAPSATVGDRDLRSIAVSVRAIGDRLHARAAIAQPYPLHVDVGGRRQPGRGRVMTVDTLSIRYPEATWSLVRPAQVSLGDNPGVTGLALAADRQRIAVDARLADKQRRARVQIQRFDLARLPRVLVPASLGLAGTIDADVALRDGGGGAPRIDAKASLTGGRIRGHRDLSLALSATVAGGRARGRLDARALATAATARFDVPADVARLRSGRAPMRLDVDVADIDLPRLSATIAEATGKPLGARLQGRARLSVRLSGTAQRPQLTVAAAAVKLRADDHAIGDLTLDIAGDGARPITAKLTSAAPTHTRIDITTPLSLRELVRGPPTAATLLRTPFQIRGDVDRLPLAALARAARTSDQRIGGTVSSHIELRGPVVNPAGTVAFDVAGVTSGRFPPTDARVELEVKQRACEARVRITRKTRPLLALQASLEIPVAAARDPEALAAAPLRVRAVVGPLALQRLGLPPETDRAPPRAFNGRLHADVSIDGTLRAPTGVVHVQVDDVRLDKTFVGYARVEASYGDRQAKLDARLTTQNGGTLHATTATNIDLGYPGVTRPLDVRRLPLDVRIDAKDFDLRGLSGATDDLRTVAGLLTASATVTGTVADPKIAGRVDWRDGVVAITGLGEYDHIHLALHGDAARVVVDELVASSGAGKARITGDGTRATTGKGYEIALQSDLQRFPIYKQGQPLANVSLESKLKGRVSPFDTRVTLDIADARIELAEAQRRNLQSLEPPADVVLVDGDRPLNRAQDKKLRALTAAAAPDDVQPAADQPQAPSLRMKVNAPRRLWVSGKDANLELGLAPDFRIHVNDRTRIFGQVTVHRGRIDVFGRRFDLKSDSTLTWSGRPDRPEVNVRAEHVNETESVTVLLTAKGPLDKMTVTVSSPNRPELSESQLYTLLITGHLQLGSGTSGTSSASAQAVSLLGGLVASQLQKTLAGRLPLDVLTIDAGREGFRGTRLEAGRYVTDKLYVGYVGRIGADPTRYQNRNAVHLEYQLTSRWEIAAEYGDVGTGTADLMWKKNY